MGGGIKRMMEEKEQKRKEKRRSKQKAERDSYRRQLINKLENLNITGKDHDAHDQEIEDIIWIMRNKKKILANKELLSLINNW